MSLLARRALSLAVFLILLPATSGAGTKPTHEYDLKAAFMFHFAQFVEWPPEALPNGSTPLTIGFVITQKRLRLAVNLAAANAARLTISSKLLRQSEIVGPLRVQE